MIKYENLPDIYNKGIEINEIFDVYVPNSKNEAYLFCTKHQKNKISVLGGGKSYTNSG